MADYSALKAELALPEYNGLDDAAAAAHYNAKTVSTARSVPLGEFNRYVLDQGVYIKLVARMKDTSTDPTHLTAMGAAQTILDLVKYGLVDAIDVSQPAFSGGLQALAALGDVTTQNAADLSTLATVTTPYYQQPGQFGVPVTANDVNHARSLP